MSLSDLVCFSVKGLTLNSTIAATGSSIGCHQAQNIYLSRIYLYIFRFMISWHNYTSSKKHLSHERLYKKIYASTSSHSPTISRHILILNEADSSARSSVKSALKQSGGDPGSPAKRQRVDTQPRSSEKKKEVTTHVARGARKWVWKEGRHSMALPSLIRCHLELDGIYRSTSDVLEQQQQMGCPVDPENFSQRGT